ncbi:MAG: lysophospholipid acyltransferase family protein [Candidatus Omnitrophica bacterium]|nr:lysophospholipid acyltransferase family protein [Candidatus Omnitrophota bacterium]
MDLKKLRKTSGRFFGWLALLICSLIIRFLPTQCLYGFAKILTKIGFLAVIKQRTIALESLSVAFGREKSAQELKKITKDCFAFLARSGVEIIFFMRKPQMLRNKVVMQNKHILDGALSKGRGVILVSGHFGNFPLAMLRLRLEGYSVGGIMRHMRDQRVERMFAKLRDSFGLRTIYSQPRKACVDITIRALKNNEIVCIQLDQNFGTAGVFVDFFGQKAATATGPVVLALRTKAALLPCFIIREEDNTHRIIFEQEFDLRQEDSFNKTVLLNIQRLTGIIEDYIRRYPAHWGWIHRRWKTKPKEDVAL